MSKLTMQLIIFSCITDYLITYLITIYLLLYYSLVAQSTAQSNGHNHCQVLPVDQSEPTTHNVDSILKRRVTWAPDVGSTPSPPSLPPNCLSRPHSLPVAVKPPPYSVTEPKSSPENFDAKPKKSKGSKVLSRFRKMFRRSAADIRTVDETSSNLTLSPVDDMLMLSTQLNSSRTAI